MKFLGVHVPIPKPFPYRYPYTRVHAYMYTDRVGDRLLITKPPGFLEACKDGFFAENHTKKCYVDNTTTNGDKDTYCFYTFVLPETIYLLTMISTNKQLIAYIQEKNPLMGGFASISGSPGSSWVLYFHSDPLSVPWFTEIKESFAQQLIRDGLAFPYVSYRIDTTKLKEKEAQAQK